MRALDIFADVRFEPKTMNYKIRRRLFSFSARLVSLTMGLRANLSRRSLVGSDGSPPVTLTSYGARVTHVAKTIESVGGGSVRPSRIILWLDDPKIFGNLPRTLVRMQSRGLEILLTDNLGPHTKYYPLISQELGRIEWFVTCDDDIIYPRFWLERLVAAAKETPSTIVCHRAHRMSFSKNGVDPYATWNSVGTTQPAPTVFATGVSGVLHPREMALALHESGDRFRELCSSADDVWLNWIALNQGLAVRQIADRPRHFWITPGSQGGALMDVNWSGANDEALAALYGQEHVRLLESTDRTREDR